MFDNFSESEKLSKFHFSCQLFRTFGGPGKVFATRPPHRSGFGNNAKQCAGAMFGIFFGSEKNIVFSLFPFGDPGKVFATRPPQRSGFGNNAKQCAGAMFGIFFGSEKNIVFSPFPFGDPGKIFATRPPQRSGFGNNAKQCAGAMFGIFFGSEKFSYLHFFCQIVTTIGDPGARKVFATPPPQRIRFGNHSKNGAWWVSTYLPWTFFSSWSNLAVFPDFTSVHPDTLLQAWAAPLLLRAEAVPP